MQWRIQLYWKMRVNPRHSILGMGYPVIITIKSFKTEVKENPSSQNDKGLPPCPNPEKRLTVQEKFWDSYLYYFQLWNERIIQVKKWHSRAVFNNARQWGNNDWRIQFSLHLESSRLNIFFISELTSITNKIVKFALPFLDLMTCFLCF